MMQVLLSIRLAKAKCLLVELETDLILPPAKSGTWMILVYPAPPPAMVPCQELAADYGVGGVPAEDLGAKVLWVLTFESGLV
jgi:hypothetical protein